MLPNIKQCALLIKAWVDSRQSQAAFNPGKVKTKGNTVERWQMVERGER